MNEITQNTGDGIRMTWKAGTGELGAGVTQYFWQTFPREELKAVSSVTEDWWTLTDLTRYPNLRVNLRGERFGNEANATLYSVRGAQLHMQPKETEFVIFDRRMPGIIAARGFAGIEEPYAAFREKPEFFMEFNEPNDTAELNRNENTPRELGPYPDQFVGKTATVYKVPTLEGLARAIGVDEKTFLASVAQYNQTSESGRDELFFADGKRLIPVVKVSFHAVRFTVRNLGTLGGIRIDHRIRALTPEGEPIPGLYAAGADAGGMFGKAYVDFEGGTPDFAYTSGRLAGEDAAACSRTD